MTSNRPRVSFGLPVRNGEHVIKRCLESILTQQFSDFEVVACDNASTDRTAEILHDYAARDDRIRIFVNEEDLGQIGNFNRVFELARGEYFRWVGADDWLEPGYTSECVATLDADPGAIAVTTYFGLHDDEGRSQFQEFQGEFPDSDQPDRRFSRMLWFFHAGAGLYEPIYSLIRREALARTGRIRSMEYNDRLLAAELSLLGRLRHIPGCLFHRAFPKELMADEQRLLRRLQPTAQAQLRVSTWRLLRVFGGMIRGAPLRPPQRVRCYWAALRFCANESRKRSARRMRVFRRERLGLTRRRLRRWFANSGGR